MSDFIYQVAIRVAVMAPTLMITAAVLWYAFRYFGAAGTGAPLKPSDMRTWPLKLVLANAALFALAYAVVMVIMGESTLSAAVAGGTAAFVSIGVAPIFVARLRR